MTRFLQPTNSLDYNPDAFVKYALMRRYLHMDLIIFLVNDSFTHWYLAIVEVKEDELTIMFDDSLKNHSEDQHRKIAQILPQAFEYAELCLQRAFHDDRTEPRKVSCANIQGVIQPNTFSCGVCMSVNAFLMLWSIILEGDVQCHQKYKQNWHENYNMTMKKWLLAVLCYGVLPIPTDAPILQGLQDTQITEVLAVNDDIIERIPGDRSLFGQGCFQLNFCDCNTSEASSKTCRKHIHLITRKVYLLL